METGPPSVVIADEIRLQVDKERRRARRGDRSRNGQARDPANPGRRRRRLMPDAGCGEDPAGQAPATGGESRFDEVAFARDPLAGGP